MSRHEHGMKEMEASGRGEDGVSGAAQVDVAGLVLAGGQARRMGGVHKAFVELDGRPLMEHVLERLRPQVSRLLVSANAQVDRLAALPGVDAVLPDVVPGFAGPLAGVLSGLEWLRRESPDTRWMLSVAVDMPFLPRDLCARMLAVASGAVADAAPETGGEQQCRAVPVVAAGGGRLHPVVVLWPVALAEPLREALARGVRKVLDFLQVHDVVVARLAEDDAEPFFNINTQEDLQRAGELLRSR